MNNSRNLMVAAINITNSVINHLEGDSSLPKVKASAIVKFVEEELMKCDALTQDNKNDVMMKTIKVVERKMLSFDAATILENWRSI